MVVPRLFDVLAGVLLGGTLASGCSSATAFTCDGDDACPDGRCESSGYCSFPAEDCESGYRYGEFSGSFSGRCVAPQAGTGGQVTASGSGSGSTPTTGPTTGSGGEEGSGASDPTAGTDTTASPTVCPPTSMCVPVPPGWEGPIELVDGDACGGADPVLIGASAYDGPWGCECSCSVGAPPTCEGVNVELDVYDVPSCDGDPFTTLVLPDICQNIMLGDAASVFGSTQQEASCETEAVVSAEPVVAIDPQVGCAAPTESCDGGACVGDERSLCIYIPGDTECPAGVFQSRSVLYQGHLDQRSCSACTCTGSFSCDGNVMIRTDPAGCSSPGGLEVPLETCSSEVTTIRALDVTLAEVPTSSCQVRGAENQGGLVPDQPVTVCCAS